MTASKPIKPVPLDLVVRVLNWYQELADADERIIIIVAAAKLEESITRLLKAHMLHQGGGNDDLFGHDRPLGTFSSRILLAFRLGIINRDFESFLQTLRKLRNEAAHSPERMDLLSSPQIQWIEHLVLLASKSPAWTTVFKDVSHVSARENPRSAVLKSLLIALFNCEVAALTAKPFAVETICEFGCIGGGIADDDDSDVA